MKYLPNGQAVEVIQQLNDGWLVNDIVDIFEGDFMTMDPVYVVKQVFDKAPTVKYDEKIQKLTETIASLQESRKKVEALLRSEEKTREEKLEKFRKIDQLKLLEDFIDGKITHYVELGYLGPDIVKFEDIEVDQQYDRRNTMRLLTLYGRTDGDLEWRLSEHSDGSGSKRTVIPCTSYEMALAEVQKYIGAKDPEKPDEDIVKIAEKHALKLPVGYAEKLRANKRSKLKKVIESGEKDLQKNKAALLEIIQWNHPKANKACHE